MRSVPFTVKEVHYGFSKAHGVAYVEDDSLVLEVKTSVLGLFAAPASVHRIEMTDLDEVRHKRRFGSDELTIRTRPMEIIAAVPGGGQGELALVVKRKHRADIDALLERLDLWRTAG